MPRTDGQLGKGVAAVPGVRHRFVDVGELELHVAEAGEAGAPAVILLHGFPEFWWTWSRQLPALAAAGLHVLAPDLRGYHLSDRPSSIEAYRMKHLVADVRGLVRALPGGRAAIVGHDWGGVTAFLFAERHPELVERLAILNAPHPAALRRELARLSDQVVRSAYMLPLQLPRLPELLLSAHDHLLLRKALRALHAQPVDDAELEPYVEAFRASGLTGPLNYYRAFGRSLLRASGWARPSRPAEGEGSRSPNWRASVPEVVRPTLVIWGMADPALGPGLAQPPPWFSDVRIERVHGSAHDVHHDATAQVNGLLTAFLKP